MTANLWRISIVSDSALMVRCEALRAVALFFESRKCSTSLFLRNS